MSLAKPEAGPDPPDRGVRRTSRTPSEARGPVEEDEINTVVLFSGHDTKLFQFVAPSHHRHDAPPPPESRFNQTLVASGTLIVYKMLGREKAAFIRCGSFVHPILPKSRMWRTSAYEFVLPQPIPGRYYRVLMNEPVSETAAGQVATSQRADTANGSEGTNGTEMAGSPAMLELVFQDSCQYRNTVSTVSQKRVPSDTVRPSARGERVPRKLKRSPFGLSSPSNSPPPPPLRKGGLHKLRTRTDQSQQSMSKPASTPALRSSSPSTPDSPNSPGFRSEGGSPLQDRMDESLENSPVEKKEDEGRRTKEQDQENEELGNETVQGISGSPTSIHQAVIETAIAGQETSPESLVASPSSPNGQSKDGENGDYSSSASTLDRILDTFDTTPIHSTTQSVNPNAELTDSGQKLGPPFNATSSPSVQVDFEAPSASALSSPTRRNRNRRRTNTIETTSSRSSHSANSSLSLDVTTVIDGPLTAVPAASTTATSATAVSASNGPSGRLANNLAGLAGLVGVAVSEKSSYTSIGSVSSASSGVSSTTSVDDGNGNGNGGAGGVGFGIGPATSYMSHPLVPLATRNNILSSTFPLRFKPMEDDWLEISGDFSGLASSSGSSSTLPSSQYLPSSLTVGDAGSPEHAQEYASWASQLTRDFVSSSSTFVSDKIDRMTLFNRRPAPERLDRDRLDRLPLYQYHALSRTLMSPTTLAASPASSSESDESEPASGGPGVAGDSGPVGEYVSLPRFEPDFYQQAVTVSGYVGWKLWTRLSPWARKT